MNATTTRQRQSLQRQPSTASNDVAANVARAHEHAGQVRRANALNQLAGSLNIDANSLKNTLMNTVFKVRVNNQDRTPTDEEFAALIIVANEYELNPITKEFYAFPAKGGGIVPVISVDGWIKIMNRHPMFDGIEFDDISDTDGKLIGIETVIFRKDRTKPIRITEYLDECIRDTDPWRKSPARMLRHKSIIQAVRLAFGVSGALAEDEVEIIGDIRMGGDLTPSREPAPMRNITPASRQVVDRREQPQQQQQQQSDESYDPNTGEVIQEGRPESDMGEEHRDPQTGLEIDAQEAMANDIIARAKSVEIIADYNSLAAEMQPHIDAMSDENMAGECNRALRAARERITGKRGR